jgi:hypothetical protein
MGIETHGHMGGLLVIDEFENGVGETKLGIGISSLAGDTWIADECIVGTKYKRKCI